MDHLTKARLEWMFYNEPEYAKEFLDQNRLGELDQILINRLKQALDYMEVLKKSGRSQYEAEDVAIEVVLAPADGRAFSDHPPKPLSLDDQEKVYRKLERRQELWNWLIDKYGTPTPQPKDALKLIQGGRKDEPKGKLKGEFNL